MSLTGKSVPGNYAAGNFGDDGASILGSLFSTFGVRKMLRQKRAQNLAPLS
jgi:hypothetical protein